MKKNLIWLLTAVVALAVPSLAQGKAGQLDKTFGTRGRVITLLGPTPAPYPWITPFESGSQELRTWLARTPAREIVVLVGNTLFEYRPSGHLDRTFGTNGQVAVGVPPGTTLEPSGMTVDSRGRILVTGTVRSTERNVASVFVARYQEGGRPDQSFGDGGIVLTDLGLSAPTPPDPSNLARPPAIEGPIVESSGLAVDALDRPLLTGTWVSTYRLCYPAVFRQQDVGYLARLDASGAVDPGFATAGVAVDPTREARFSPVVDGDAVLSIGKFVQYCHREELPYPELARNEKDGDLDEDFGVAGRVAAPYAVTTIARDPFGRAFVLGSGGQRGGVEGAHLLRLRRNGSIDGRFGKGDVELPLELPLDPVYLAEDWHPALASDGRGRPLFAASEGEGLTLGRLRRDGAADRRFGRGGLVFTRFPGEVRPEQILGGGGKILVGGTWSKDGDYGIALARYSGG